LAKQTAKLNSPEFISKDLDRQAYENRVILDYSRLGKPTDNPFIKFSSGSFRDECLNMNWFLSLEDANTRNLCFKGVQKMGGDQRFVEFYLRWIFQWLFWPQGNIQLSMRLKIKEFARIN